MPQSSKVVRPESPGSPSYTAASRLQAAGLQSGIDLFVSAAQVVPLPAPPQPIVIADYGASTGLNSLLPINAAIAALRGRTRKEHAIVIAHTDVADNDFTALFRTLSDDPDSYLHGDAAVFTSAVGRSFYQQILPSYSVTLGWTSWATHWLSRVAPVPDHILPACSADAAVRAACVRQAAEDWHEFVAFRGRELVRGGRLVVLTMGADESGEFGMRALIDVLYATLQELVGAGLITTDELVGMSLPIVGRTEEDFVAPFLPKGRFEGCSIEHLEVFDAEDRFWQRYQVDGDANVLGAQWASFLRAAVFDALIGGLRGGAADPRVPRFRDELERGVAARLAAAPTRMRIRMAKLVLAKAPRAQ